MSPIRSIFLGLVLAGAVLGQPAATPKSETPTKAAGLTGPVTEDLRWLTAPERKGRGRDPEWVVAGWLEARFRQAGLLPLFGESYRQPFKMLTQSGRNVGGILPGKGWPENRRHVIVSAHHDHLGVRDGVVHPGAADNAAGVAAMLEILRRIAPRKAELSQTVVFLGFDLEEAGLFGSRVYCRKPALPLAECTVFTTFDILGRGVLDLPGARLAVLGWERAPALLGEFPEPAADAALDVTFLGSDVIGDRSDYAPFRDRDVPFLFFTTGENRDYHRPTDTFERLDEVALAAQLRYVVAVLRLLCQLEERPEFTGKPSLQEVEARSVGRILDAVLAAQGDSGGLLVRQVAVFRKRVDDLLADGDYSAKDRDTVVGIVRTLMSLSRLIR